MAVRVGIIDIGTSSIKLIIGEAVNGHIHVLEYLKNLVPVGKDVFFRSRISPEATKQTVAILEKYKKVIKEFDVTTLKVIATTAAREAENNDIFLDTIFRLTGFNVEVLTAGDVIYFLDAYLYNELKERYPIHSKNVLIVELGSGNVDISLLEKGFTVMSVGLPLGPLRLRQLTAKLEGSTLDVNEAVEQYVGKEIGFIKRYFPDIKIDDVIMIDENYSEYLRQISGLPDPGSKFFPVAKSYAEKMLRELHDRTPDEIAADYKVSPEYSDTITAFSTIINSFIRTAEVEQIYMFEASLSEAILANIALDYELSSKYNKSGQLLSLVRFICKKFNVDRMHSEHVALIAEVFFENLREQMGLKKSDLLYLTLSAYLHDIGMSVSNRSHHKHSEYMINALNLFRLSDEEIKIIACVARYHRKSTPQDSHLLFKSLPLGRQILVQKLSAILRVANSLDSSHRQKIEKIVFNKGHRDHAVINLKVKDNFIFEKHEFYEKVMVLEEIIGNKIILKIQAD